MASVFRFLERPDGLRRERSGDLAQLCSAVVADDPGNLVGIELDVHGLSLVNCSDIQLRSKMSDFPTAIHLSSHGIVAQVLQHTRPIPVAVFPAKTVRPFGSIQLGV